MFRQLVLKGIPQDFKEIADRLVIGQPWNFKLLVNSIPLILLHYITLLIKLSAEQVSVRHGKNTGN